MFLESLRYGKLVKFISKDECNICMSFKPREPEEGSGQAFRKKVN